MKTISDLVTFFFDEFDLNFPEDGIYKHETFLRQNEDVCKKLCQAVLSSWEYAFQNKEETLQIVLDYCDRYKYANKLLGTKMDAGCDRKIN
jgi:NitT/TauT family transport system substrate-binding protein